MNWNSIELHKVEREIYLHGGQYTFNRDVLDNYGEPMGETTEVATIRGLFHISKGYASRNVSDGTITRIKGSPMLLAKYNDTLEISQGDYIHINEKKYVVNEINNIMELDIVSEISLEVVLDGNKN
jgi:hypothetical protein